MFHFDLTRCFTFTFTMCFTFTLQVLYDIWGDTVNLASRMMSTGVVGRIQLPAACVPFLIDHFKLPRRGKVRVKGKGDMITHFCVERKTPEQIRSNIENRAANSTNSTDA